MRVELARTAGFCYGVRRAVQMAEEAAGQGRPCVMLGPIIHNRDEISRLEAMGVGALRLAVQEGDVQRGTFLAGEIAGMVNREQPAAEIIREIFTEAEQVLQGATKWVR